MFRVWEADRTTHKKTWWYQTLMYFLFRLVRVEQLRSHWTYFSDVLCWEYLLAHVYWMHVLNSPGKKQSAWWSTCMYAVGLCCGDRLPSLWGARRGRRNNWRCKRSAWTGFSASPLLWDGGNLQESKLGESTRNGDTRYETPPIPSNRTTIDNHLYFLRGEI
jgi:hypothetical protein